MPTSLITNWTKEFAKWTPGMRAKEFHGTSKGERTRNLENGEGRHSRRKGSGDADVGDPHDHNKPYFLRRTKSEVQKNKKGGTDSLKEQHSDHNDVPRVPKDSGAVMPELTRKNDLIVWTYLSSVQEDIYRQFISLDHIKELLLTTRSLLAELNIMKKLCDHPRLLSAAPISKLGLEENGGEGQQGDEADTDAHSIDNVPDDTLISESGKLVFLFALLERLREEGHRTLVFAHYRKVLDIIERILGNRGFKVLRLDGTIKQIAERERRILCSRQTTVTPSSS
ncbi:DNA excision repair protein ERCC-6-like [Acanthochromis polyacanthus]|uniref:DNA excision repair protein ERCC-6-like n=1 Tax=Acanthochromis polyacanthus TaxID=80966 RepID=UPI0022341603|nr:DNA excision repair protein ERCC-6-like [Acanthochromis polyacanthus]